MRTLTLLAPLCLAGALRADNANDPPQPSIPWQEIVRGLPSHERCKEAEAVATALYCWHRDGLTGCVPGAVDTSSWAWWHAQHATNPGLVDSSRERAVRDLIDLLGWEAVLTGRLPSPIPD